MSYTATEIAELITEATDYTVRVWFGADRERVYVTRLLSRGRKQDMGYIEITDGEISLSAITRQAGIIRQAIQSASWAAPDEQDVPSGTLEGPGPRIEYLACFPFYSNAPQAGSRVGPKVRQKSPDPEKELN